MVNRREKKEGGKEREKVRGKGRERAEGERDGGRKYEHSMDCVSGSTSC